MSATTCLNSEISPKVWGERFAAEEERDIHRRGWRCVAMPGLHLHRGMGRGEKRRWGPDIVSVKTGQGGRDGVEFREGPEGIVVARLQNRLDSVLETTAREAW
jgi:hypothetical protein